MNGADPISLTMEPIGLPFTGVLIKQYRFGC